MNNQTTITNPDNKDVSYWLERICVAVEKIQSNQETLVTQQREILSKLSPSTNNTSTPTPTEVQSHAEKKISASDSTIWNQQLTIRKHAYYNMIRSNGISDIYKEGLNQPDPTIPAKFREKRFPGQSEAHKARQKKLEVVKVQVEIDRLQEQAEKQEAIIGDTESRIGDLISNYEDHDFRDELIKCWVVDINREQDLSKSIWEKRKPFFIKSIQNENEDNERPPHTKRAVKHTTHKKTMRNQNKDTSPLNANAEVIELISNFGTTLQNILQEREPMNQNTNSKSFFQSPNRQVQKR